MVLMMLWFLDSSFASISHRTLGMKQEIPLRTSVNGKSLIQRQVTPLVIASASKLQRNSSTFEQIAI